MSECFTFFFYYVDKFIYNLEEYIKNLFNVDEYHYHRVIKSPKENVKVNYNTISSPKNDEYIKDWDIV